MKLSFEWGCSDFDEIEPDRISFTGYYYVIHFIIICYYYYYYYYYYLLLLFVIIIDIYLYI